MLSQVLSVAALAAAAQAVSVSVAASGGNATSPYQYGIMFEDINNAGDGGMYAELIQNRAFQGDEIFPKNLDYWNPLGGAKLALVNDTTPLSAALPTSVEVSAGNTTTDTLGLSNVGFWGFPVVAGEVLTGTFYAKGGLDGNLSIALVSNDDHYYVETSVEVSSSATYKKYDYTLVPTVSAPNSNTTLNFTFASSDLTNSVNFNFLSLFPPTYKNRPNGNRVDLSEALAGLYPSFFRLPGGNNIEGIRKPYLWYWNETVGPLIDRPGYPGTWGYEQTNGLGLIEYLEWSNELGTEPVFAVWSGLWLDGTVVPEDELQPYVQLALDELEFLMGDASTPYGAQREALGYGPFQINFVEVGNEDSLLKGSAPTYSGYRFPAFYNAIKAAYPAMTIIASYYDVDGTVPLYTGTAGDFHEYAIPLQMSEQFGYFDNYTADHPILIGEYAVIEYNTPGQTGPQWYAGAGRAYTPFWYGSCAEAIFLLSAERSPAVIGASYAPTFQNLNKWEWIPDMIQFDAFPGHTTLGTSWHMLNLLSGTRITENLPMTITNGGFGPAYFVAGRSAVTGSHIIKIVNYNSTVDTPFQLNFAGVGAGAIANLTYLTAPMNASNPIGGNIVEKTTKLVHAQRNGTLSFSLPDWSVAVLEVSAGQAGYGHNYGNGHRQGWKGWKGWGRDQWHHGGAYNQWGQSWGH